MLHSATATTVDAVALGSTMEHYGASIRCYGIYQSLLMYGKKSEKSEFADDWTSAVTVGLKTLGTCSLEPAETVLLP